MFLAVIGFSLATGIADSDKYCGQNHGEGMFDDIEAGCCLFHCFTGEVTESHWGDEVEGKSYKQLYMHADHCV